MAEHRTVAAIDRNLASCRAGLAVEPNEQRRTLIKGLIDDLLTERAEHNTHCTMCGGAGKLLPGGQCSLCDRRRCMLRNRNDEVVCTEYVENIYATRCPKGHPLPGR